MAYSLFPKTRYSRYDAVVVRCKTGKPCRTKSGAIVCIPKKHTCSSEKSSDESDHDDPDSDSPNHSNSPIVTLHTREKEIDIGRFPEEASPEATNRLKIGAIAGATVVAALGGAAGTIAMDMQKAQVPFDSIPPNPPGNPEDWKELHEYYNTLKPGDLIRKNFKVEPLGTMQHYGIYAGKDPNVDPNSIHSHLVIEVAPDPNTRDHQLQIRQQGLTWFPSAEQIKNESSWEKVPAKDMYLKEGTKQLSQREIMNRANKMLYQNFSYQGFEGNCENFARGIVEGKAYSTQGDKVSAFTRHVSSIVTEIGLSTRIRVNIESVKQQMKELERKGETSSAKYKDLQGTLFRAEAEGGKAFNTSDEPTFFKLGEREITGISSYATDKNRRSAKEMVEFLEHAKARSEARRVGNRDYRPYDASKLNDELPRKSASSPKEKTAKKTKKISFFEGIFASLNKKGRKDAVNDEPVTLLDPKEFIDNLMKISAKYPSLSKQIQINGIKNYLLVFYSLLNNTLAPTTK
ncbi:MAG: lecithin retinol acyltransferase family protein [Microcoleaceae cyanobacterium]